MGTKRRSCHENCNKALDFGEFYRGIKRPFFTQIFDNRSPCGIATIAQFYKQIAGDDLYVSLEEDFPGNIEWY